jgi:hypothetical protein
MSRRSPRYRARFAATVQIAGVEHTLVCHTRDISSEGCFLDTKEMIAEGVTVDVALLDNERGEAVQVRGVVARSLRRDGLGGIGLRLIDPPAEWHGMVARYRERDGEEAGSRGRLSILVVGEEDHRRGALALYVTSGWDVRFAVDLAAASEALSAVELDAVIAEHAPDDERVLRLLEETRRLQPRARRLVRCALKGPGLAGPPGDPSVEGLPAGLVHRIVDSSAGLDALVDALTSALDTSPLDTSETP